MHLALDGKTALITGASHGIGKAIGRVLSDEGVECYDASRSSGIDLLLVNVKKLPNTFDILINNVGGGGSWGNEKYEEFKDWEDVYYKNADLTRQLTNHILPYMIKQGWGRVISIGSIFGKESGGKPWFTMAKASLIAYMKEMSRNPRYNGITFNTISPGHIDVGKPFPDKPKILGKPLDVANIVTFLCSEKAKHINGTNIVVDGGYSRSF